MSHDIYLTTGVETRYNVKIPMRDGVNLSADIYLPKGKDGPFPTVLYRTPYDNSDYARRTRGIDNAVRYAQAGYAYVAQDARGRNDSDGEFYPWVNEYDDGFDTVEWIGSQDWCDGNVGMSGASYVGNVQWMVAATGSRYLKAIAPTVIGSNLHESPHYQGGAFQLALNATWTFMVDGRTWQNIDLYDWKRLLMVLPLKAIPEVAGKRLKHYEDWLDHPDYDDYWKALSIEERYEDIAVPALSFGGWYDVLIGGTLNNFVGMRERGGSELARQSQKIVIGPWVHFASAMTHAGEIDFGKDSVLDLIEIELRWYDRWLKGEKNGIDEEAPIKLFVMGTNQWRNEHEWPLARTRFTPYYIHGNGSANSLTGDGTLSTEPPDRELHDTYEYNPAFPTPTNGGCNCCVPDLVPWGGFDQRPVEFRSDVLVYTSEPLEEDLEVTGPVIMKLYASTDGRDTDFTAKLVDVHPDGHAVNLCDGLIRGRYRESKEVQRLLEPGTVYEFEIDLWPTSNVFLKGHRIRVDVASANFPRFDRNLNTGNPVGDDTEIRVARQRVFHDAEHPSHIILPVIPSG